jgi:nanoRNase/pAp phosphatase (c-di-AMP/oligoRNAs hydrolase)
MKVSRDSQLAFKTLADSQKAAVVVSARPSLDALGAAMSLYHLLLDLGKTVRIVVPGKVPKEARSLPGSAEIKDNFGPRNLVVTLDTNSSPIDKVSYKSEGQKFKLTIHPRGRDFAVEDIHYEYSGLDFDLLALVGVPRLEDLGDLYRENRRDFEGNIILNLDISPQNELYGQINIVDTSKGSLAELLFSQLVQWDRVPSKSVAQSLLVGLSATPKHEKIEMAPARVTKQSA